MKQEFSLSGVSVNNGSSSSSSVHSISRPGVTMLVTSESVVPRCVAAAAPALVTSSITKSSLFSDGINSPSMPVLLPQVIILLFFQIKIIFV